MLDFILAIGIFVLLFTMTTIGAVLLAKFWLGNLQSSVRVFVAIVIGSTAPVGLVLLAAFTESDWDQELAAALALVVVIPLLLVGWPTAFFATRKLDKLTEIKPSVFE